MEFPSIDSFACKSVITVIASWHRAGEGGRELSRVGFGTQLVPRERGGEGRRGFTGRAAHCNRKVCRGAAEGHRHNPENCGRRNEFTRTRVI